MIKKYANKTAYEAAGKPTDESRVALIEEGNDIKTDGVNVEMAIPGDGDAVLLDAQGGVHFIRFDTIIKSLLPAGWTHIGYAFGLKGNVVKILDKAIDTTRQWLAVWQYTISAISAATIKFWLKCKGDYATFLPVEVTLTDSSDGYLNAQSVSEINAVLETIGNTGYVGYAGHGYWAYLEDGKIVVQCDFNGDYRQYQCSDSTHALVGCTMALSVWGDMPASNALWRNTKLSTYYGGMNFDRFYTYYAANGATPSANVAVNAEAPVNKASFDSSQYCAALRSTFGDYATYLRANMVMWPQAARGVFKLIADISADEMTQKYGAMTATKKDGTDVYKFPALRYGLTIGYGTGRFAAGKWHTADVDEGMEFMNADTLPKIAEAGTRMGAAVLTNSVYRWFARRYYAYNAWFFNGTNGVLYNNNVSNAYRCSAVTLYRLD